MKIVYDPETGRTLQINKADFRLAGEDQNVVLIRDLSEVEYHGLLLGEWIILNGVPTLTPAALTGAKTRKIEEIQECSKREILAGFISPSQSGLRLSYDIYAQVNFSSVAAGLALDPSAVWDDPVAETIIWRAHDPVTDAVSYLNLSGPDFIEIFKEAGSHKKTILQKAWALQSDVESAVTVQDVEAILW